MIAPPSAQYVSAVRVTSAVQTPPGGPQAAGEAAQPVFSPAEIEQLGYRRFNPLPSLNAQTLSAALDAFGTGNLRPAARLWEEIARRDPTIQTVKGKRAEAVALRDWTVTALDDSSEAADQAEALRWFYRRLRAGHAINRNSIGGFPLLITQMLDAVSFAYACHHLIWQPNPAQSLTLPSGRTVPGLGLLAELVPLEFFEGRTGELRFLGLDEVYNGTPLAPGDWMITTGPGLMYAASIRHYFKRLAEHDLVNFSEKFGTPGLVVHTTAQAGSPEAAAAAQLARSLASNYRGVQYGAMENKVEVFWPEGGTSGSNLPMTHIIEEAERKITSLFLGADLSTMSRGGSGGHGVGASLQADEQEKRERADCALVSETLQATIDPVVIRWFFGEDAPVLARVALESPINEDRALLGNLVNQLVNLGARVPVAEVARRMQVPVVPEKDPEPVLVRGTAATPATPESVAVNSDPFAPGTPGAKLLTTAQAQLATAKQGDFAPLTDRLDAIARIDNPVIQRAALVQLRANLPVMLHQMNADPKTARVLSDAMSAVLCNGVVQAAVDTHGSAASLLLETTP